MKIADLLSIDGIILDKKPETKSEAIDILIDRHVKLGNIKNKRNFRKAILNREKCTTTGIGGGMAIPHAMTKDVKRAGLVAMRVDDGIDFEALDSKPVNLIFMIAMPDDGKQHMEVLSHLATLFMDESLRPALLSAKSAKEFISIIDKLENRLFPSEADDTSSEEEKVHLLAVTACPMGISHTYLAAEALEKAAHEMGVSIKVETNGSGGAANILTEEEIVNADAIIIAADKNVSMERFDGKRVIITSVTKGVRNPHELIDEALDKSLKPYKFKGDKGAEPEEKNEKHIRNEGVAHRFYKYLMSGVSYMLPFAVGGGILQAASYLVDLLVLGGAATENLNFGTGTEVSAFLNALGGYAFNFMMPILAGYIAMSIADRPALAVGMVGGFIANIGMTFTEPSGMVPSGFLGAIIAGFFSGGLMRLLQRICSYMPKSFSGLKSVLVYPVVGIALIGFMMGAINPFAALLNNSLTYNLNALDNSSKIILGCILGGMMAIDMGGPLSKAAYLYGTVSIASGGLDVMAAVMIGGMTPPIGIALATTFFKKKFSDAERKSGLVNYILGLCFITEGAIPYAAADPLAVIPSCVIGSSLAGGLSMAFGCTLHAPHGGIFVIPFIGNATWYLAALAAGSFATMLMLALLKRREPIKIKKHILSTGVFD